MRTSPTPSNPSSVRTLTMVRLRQAVPITRGLTSGICPAGLETKPAGKVTRAFPYEVCEMAGPGLVDPTRRHGHAHRGHHGAAVVEDRRPHTADVRVRFAVVEGQAVHPDPVQLSSQGLKGPDTVGRHRRKLVRLAISTGQLLVRDAGEKNLADRGAVSRKATSHGRDHPNCVDA